MKLNHYHNDFSELPNEHSLIKKSPYSQSMLKISYNNHNGERHSYLYYSFQHGMSY